jgi:DNA-binding transcriptional LysR family regulator
LGGRLDICATLDVQTNIVLDSKKIGSLELIMVCNLPDMSLEDVSQMGHVFVDWGTAFNLQQARLFSEPVAPILHTGQSHIALEFILSHRGAAYLPLALVESYLQEQRLFKVVDAQQISQEVYLIYPKTADKAASLGPIINFLEELDLKPETSVQMINE